MKRLITILTILSLLVSFPAGIPTVSAAAETNAELLLELGCIDSETAALLNSGANVTRSTLAAVIQQVAKLEGEDKAAFADVDASDPNRTAISVVSQYGFMKGDGAGNFRPDSEAKELEALVAFLRILGYEEYASYHGGYPNGYYETARALKLTSGTGGISISEPLSAETLGILLKNLIDEPVYQSIGFSGQIVKMGTSDRTFLSIYYGIDKVQGVMTGNTATLLDRVSENSGIVIDGRLLQTQDTVYDAYIGMEVEAYYDREETTPICVRPTKRNQLTEIDARDILGTDGNRLIYETASGREQSFTFPADAYIIYNQRAADFSYDLFDIASGGITLIDNNGDGRVDVVSILSYETVIIDSVNSVELQIHLKYGAGFLGEEILEEVEIYDENGLTDIAWLHEWDALDLMKSDTGEMVAIYCAGESKSKIPAEISLGGKDSHIVFQDGSISYIQKNAIERFRDVKLGEMYLFSTDKFGYLAACTPDSVDKIGALIGISAEESVLDTTVQVKLFTENSEFIIRSLSDRFAVNDTVYHITKDEERATARKALEASVGDLLEFRTDAKGNIVAVKTMDVLFNGTGQVYGNKNSNCVTTDEGTVFFRMDALAFYIPENPATADEKNTRISNTTALGVPNTTLTAYRRQGGVEPEADAVKFVSQGRASVTMGEYDQPAVIEKKSQVYSAEDEAVYSKLTYWYNGSQHTAMIEDEQLAAEVDPGDVAYVELNSDGAVLGFIKFYDYSEDSLTDGYVPGAFRTKHRRQIGYVYQTFHNLYSLTAEDISGEFDPGALKTEMHRFPNNGYVFDSGKGTVRKANRSDFAGYTDNPERYSRIFAFSTYSIDYMGVVYI